MSRRFVLVAALALACTVPMPAAATTYVYSIYNLTFMWDTPGPTIWPPQYYSGYFDGEDLNGDNLISLAELTSFRVGTDVRGDTGLLLPSVSGWVGPGCIPEPFPEQCITHSHMDAFSYNLDTGAFDAHGANDSYEGWFIDTGVGVGFVPPPSGNTYGMLAWTPQTYVTVRPIPEPHTWALMAMGLLGLGGARTLLRRLATGDKAQEPHAHA